MLTRLPALADVHVHLREPGATHKEDWDSGTAAALAGGITTVLAMPNTNPAIQDAETLQAGLALAAAKAHCDYAQYLGGGAGNAADAASAAPGAAGLKLYLDQTYGDLKLDDMRDWQPHFAAWPHAWPLCAHAEGKTMAAAILLAALHDRPLHICHVSTAEEIALIRGAKERGLKITCEVCPQHLLLCEDDIPSLGAGRAEVRPRLASKADQQALWANLEIIDCFASDHAPHTLEEKDSADPPPGYPGLETMLPLLLNAVHERRLSLDDLIARLHTNPARIFRLPLETETYTEVDLNSQCEIRAAEGHTRCGWTPFEGWQVRGRVVKVALRGRPAYQDGRLLSQPGDGRNIRSQIGG